MAILFCLFLVDEVLGPLAGMDGGVNELGAGIRLAQGHTWILCLRMRTQAIKQGRGEPRRRKESIGLRGAYPLPDLASSR